MAFRLQLPEKLLPLLEPRRYKVLHGGRGSAKSWSVARTLVHLATIRPIRVLCARETQKSIQESVHRLLKDQIDLLGVGHLFDVQETKIIGANGSDFAFAGIRQQGVANLKSFEGVDICWVEEAQVVTKKSWDVLIPTIRKPGSEIWITFNPELEDDETYKRFVTDGKDDPNMFVSEVNYADNPWFGGELELERQTMLKRDPEGYKTTWEGQCRPAVEGAIYANEIGALVASGRIRPVPYDPMLKVHTVWDLGWNDSTSIICVQRAGSEVRIIDYIEGDHRTLADYAQDLKQRKWNRGVDWLPHDGNAKSLQTGKSPKEVLEQLDCNPEIVDNLEVEQGIHAARLMFPRCYFDKDKTSPLVNALKRYRRQQNQTTGAFGAPLHDDNSHPADAFRYLAVVVDKLGNGLAAQKINYRNRVTA
jgi:phage terminase large subunit